MKKFAIYCSGNASRVFDFFKLHDITEYKVDLVFYDGDSEDIKLRLSVLLPNSNVHFFQHESSLSPRLLSQKLSDDLLELLTDQSIDYLFCFGTKILKYPLLDRYKNRIINFHPSLLPSFPGLSAIDQALKTSVKILGNTAHFIDEGIDTGPIIMQSVILRKNYKNYDDVLELQIPMLQRIWSLLNEDRIILDENGFVTILNDSSNGSSLFST